MYTFAQPLTRALTTAPGACAVVCQDSRRTYAELGARCRRLAGAMRALGLAPGDRVGVIALNSDRYLELYLGLPAAGYVLVPINSRLAPAEMRAILDTPLVRSCGQPATGVEMRVVDDDMKDLPPGAVGQIAVRSPSVMAGYWRKPEATAEVMRGDWYLTGDLGYQDQESYIYLVDRVKDMIVSGGENIYSTEVEDALASYPGVEEVAVFGVPHPRWGESVYAVVFSRRGATPDELVAHCRQQIAGFKVPRRIELRAEPLPKSAAGKILKRKLRDPHWAGRRAQVAGG